MPTDVFPNTAWPGDIDAVQDRSDGIDVVYEEDFDYSDEQIRTIEAWLGSQTTGQMIGDDGDATHGPTGLASPVASGGVAITLAAKAAFAAGDILSVGEDYDGVYDEKMALDFNGLLWTEGGVDAGAMLIIPNAALPAFGTAGRLHWDPATPGLKYDDGAAWQDVGATAGSYLEFGIGFSQTMGGVAAEDTVGQAAMDGSKILGSLTAYFRCVVTPNMTPGAVNIRLYDMGPKAGPPAAPRLVTTLQATTNVLQVLEQALTIVPAAPGANQILNTARMYEATIEVNAVPGDDAYLGIVGIEVR